MNMDPQTALKRTKTLMLDMDGTLLDLAFDNYIWKELVPRRFAAARTTCLSKRHVELLFDRFKHPEQGDLRVVLPDHWSEHLEA